MGLLLVIQVYWKGRWNSNFVTGWLRAIAYYLRSCEDEQFKTWKIDIVFHVWMLEKMFFIV